MFNKFVMMLFALALGSLGNVRTRTARVWSADEYMKLISELP